VKVNRRKKIKGGKKSVKTRESPENPAKGREGNALPQPMSPSGLAFYSWN
jgi:hypothetical protein